MMLALLMKSTMVAVVALLAARCTRRARASVRHGVLTAMFAMLALLPLAVATLPAVSLPLLPVSAAAPGSGPITRGLDWRPEPVSRGGSTQSPVRSAVASSLPLPWPDINTAQLVVILWAVGAMLAVLWLGVGLLRVQRLRRSAIPSRDLQRVLAPLAASADVGARVDVVVHEAIAAPLTCGVVRPAIVLPPDAGDWSDDALRRALVHELEHVKRRDWPIQLLARAVCAVYWFHPLAWIAYRQLCLEAEHACDDAVVARAEETTYADQLVTLARRLATREAPAGALGMAHRSDLAARVAAVLDPSRARGRTGAWRAAAIATAAAGALFTIAPLQLVAQTSSGAAAVRDAQSPVTDARSPVEDARSPVRDTRSPVPDGDLPTRTGPPAAPADREPEAGPAQPTPTAPDQRVHDANQRVRSSRLDRSLVEAAADGDERDVLALLDAGAAIDAAVPGDGSPLIAAARDGHLRIARLLLDRGADVNLAVAGDGNPLIMAAREGHLAIVQLLVDRGADIEAMVPGDENALISASASGQLEVVRYLVSRGANVHARTWVEQVWGRQGGEWRSPLSMALREGHRAVADFLINAGAIQ